MKLLSSILLLTLTLSSCVFAVKESPKIENNVDEDRQLRQKRPAKSARSFRRAVKPKGAPKDIADSDGKVKRRQSIVDLRELLLDDDDDDVDLQLMSDEDSETLTMKRNDRIEDPFESWYGEDVATGHHLTMVKTKTPWGDTVTTGTMTGKNGTVYQIRTLADGEVVAEEVKPENFDRELDGPFTDVEGDDDVDPETIDVIDGLPGGGRRGRRNLRRLDSSSQLDILVLYTKGAMCAAAGFGSKVNCDASPTNLAKIEGVITLAVAETNKAFELSGIPTKFRLVKTHFDATYDDYTNAWEATLGNLRNNGDGKLDYVHAMRDQYGADFVSLLVDTGSYCGIGYRPNTPTAGDAFSLVQWNCATGYYSFGHEIAHNMGANHDVANSGGGTAGFNYGWKDPSAKFRSIMAYDCSPSCPRVQYFSNPSILYSGSPLGTTTANNAGLIKSNLAAYANYRQAVATVAVAPTTAAAPTQPPTRSPTVAGAATVTTTTKSLTSSLTGGYVGGPGNMIDIYASTDVYVTNFAMHATSASTVTIEVYKKIALGSCAGSQSNPAAWQKIGQATFVSSAAFSPSALPKGTFAPVFVKAGTTQSFYVTFTQATNLNRYSMGAGIGAVQAVNSDIKILEGYTKAYPFGADYTPRAWNGIVYYENAKASTTTSVPTRPPTLVATRPPTQFPTRSPTLVATRPPTLVATRPPTKPPTTTPATTAGDKLTTTFAGGNGQAGNMIEVLASKNIVVQSFDIHTFSTASVHVLVYVRKGSYVGFETNPTAWSKIADTWVMGKGSPNPTSIPKTAVKPVSIKAGETYSFYITLEESSMRYTNGKVVAGDSSMKIVRSNGNKYPFGENYPDRIWNGVLNYVPAAGTARHLALAEHEKNDDHSVIDQ